MRIAGTGYWRAGCEADALGLVSPLSTSGAGFKYEYQAAAILLSDLLGQGKCLGLPGPVARVALQQRSRGHLLDDIIVYGDLTERAPWVEFQVKRSLRPTPGNTEFVSVIGQALQALSDYEVEFERGDALLGVIAAEPWSGLMQLRELARCCSGHSTYSTFAEALLVEGVLDVDVRRRFDDVRDTVTAAAAAGAPLFGTSAESAHRLLSVLRVWPLPDGESPDLSVALDRLAGIADAADVSALTVFAHVVGLAEGWGPSAGVVDAAMVRRQLRWRGLRFERARDEQRIVEHLVADAVVRGPLMALDLDGVLENAERLLTAGDRSCVPEFARVAERLEQVGHLPHAAGVWRREATARDAFGDVDGGARRRAELAWKHLDLVQPWEAGFALHDGVAGGHGERLSAQTRRIVDLVRGAVGAGKGHGLHGLVEAFDQCEEADPYRERAAAVLCEEAVAHEQHDLLLSRQAKLASIARTAAGSPVGRRFGARIDMCLADVTGEWPALLMRSHRTSDPQVLAWMHARFARWSALDGDGATAQHHYLLAIERASAGNMYQEASDWLYAWRTVRSWYDNFDRDEQHALAQALRVHAHAGVHRLPGTEHTVEQALRALYADKPNEALERVRRWMWQAVVRADLTYEVEAVTALGDLVSTKALFTEAAEYYIRAGATDKARTAAEHITEPVDWSVAGLLRPLTASRRAAFAAIAGGADLLVDEAVAPWVEAALDEITELTPAPRRHAENAGKEAFEALAALADTLTCQQVAQLLVRVDALLDRPKARHSESDDTIIAILTTVARRHRCVQEHAVRSMLHALQINDRMADRVLGAEDVLRSNPEIVHSALAEAAHDGHHYACLALILAQADVEPARPYAKTYVEAELDPTRARRNIVSLSTKPRDAAVLAGILPADRQAEFVRTMLARVLDTDAAAAARRSDLLAIKTIAPHLDRNTRAQLFPSALEIAQGRHDREEPNPWPQHPFSRAEIVLPPSGLGVDGLRCAAALVDEPEQANLVELAAMELLGPKHPDRGWAIATVLNGLPGDLAHLQLTDLANRPQPALRALAAHRWVRNPDALSTSRAEVLAADTDHNVRRELAVAAAAVPVETRPESVERVRRILVLDRRRAIRQAADSALTATACEVTQSDK